MMLPAWIALGQLFADRSDQIYVCFAGACEYDDSGANFFFELVGNIPQLLGVDAVDLADQKLCSIYGTLLRQQFRDLVLFKLAAQLFDFSLQLFLAFQKFLDFVDGVIGAAAHQIADLLEPLFIVVNQIQGALAGERLDAPHSGGDAAFELEFEYSDLSGSAHMSATAKLGGKITDFDHAHTIAILVAEETPGRRGGSPRRNSPPESTRRHLREYAD